MSFGGNSKRHLQFTEHMTGHNTPYDDLEITPYIVYNYPIQGNLNGTEHNVSRTQCAVRAIITYNLLPLHRNLMLPSGLIYQLQHSKCPQSVHQSNALYVFFNNIYSRGSCMSNNAVQRQVLDGLLAE